MIKFYAPGDPFGCFSNFSRHEVLLSTGDRPLIEDARDDPYWGWGSSMVGENKLGRILMAVRGQIQIALLSHR